MTNFKPSSNYKYSGEQWMGCIPSNWEVTKIKWLTSIKRGASPRPIDDPKYFDEQGEYAWVRIADVSKSKKYLESTFQRMSELGSSLSVKREPGDIFLSIAGTVGKPCITNIKCCIHDGFVYFPDFKGEVRFLYYLFESGEPYKGLGKMGTQLNLNTDTVGSIVIPNLELSLQKSISDYLDFKTEQIDTLIEEKNRFISLLEEKRQSMITKAVTKGLNPNVKMKDSGSKWLGQVPEHWIITSLKNFWAVIDCKHVTAEFVDEGIPVASIREVQGRFVDLNNAKKTTKFYYDQLIKGGRKPIPGDLIFSRNATVGEVAQVASWHPAFAIGQDVCVIRKNKVDLSSDFLQYVTRSKVVIEQLENLMVGATFKRVNVEDIRNLVIPMPPSEEQAFISSFLENKIGKIDALITEVYNTINLLKEYRQSLIYEAVTGKVDVRNFEVVS
ncbi:restriction endonuclease subunit S [Peribacillus simplex]|uniref:restriction endonuclease subunit S n=1 Tax=Peribacillus simplex TaxID=1478 RepID=UPI0024C1767F|nr:restriction endonuclease subunit S [Peribacillus simplex]WHY98843.1 restriction endonuclease subunit S [Peribacillus simplex]